MRAAPSRFQVGPGMKRGGFGGCYDDGGGMWRIIGMFEEGGEEEEGCGKQGVAGDGTAVWGGDGACGQAVSLCWMPARGSGVRWETLGHLKRWFGREIGYRVPLRGDVGIVVRVEMRWETARGRGPIAGAAVVEGILFAVCAGGEECAERWPMGVCRE